MNNSVRPDVGVTVIQSVAQCTVTFVVLFDFEVISVVCFSLHVYVRPVTVRLVLHQFVGWLRCLLAVLLETLSMD